MTQTQGRGNNAWSDRRNVLITAEVYTAFVVETTSRYMLYLDQKFPNVSPTGRDQALERSYANFNRVNLGKVCPNPNAWMLGCIKLRGQDVVIKEKKLREASYDLARFPEPVTTDRYKWLAERWCVRVSKLRHRILVVLQSLLANQPKTSQAFELIDIRRMRGRDAARKLLAAEGKAITDKTLKQLDGAVRKRRWLAWSKLLMPRIDAALVAGGAGAPGLPHYRTEICQDLLRWGSDPLVVVTSLARRGVDAPADLVESTLQQLFKNLKTSNAHPGESNEEV